MGHGYYKLFLLGSALLPSTLPHHNKTYGLSTVTHVVWCYAMDYEAICNHYTTGYGRSVVGLPMRMGNAYCSTVGYVIWDPYSI